MAAGRRQRFRKLTAGREPARWRHVKVTRSHITNKHERHLACARRRARPPAIGARAPTVLAARCALPARLAPAQIGRADWPARPLIIAPHWARYSARRGRDNWRGGAFPVAPGPMDGAAGRPSAAARATATDWRARGARAPHPSMGRRGDPAISRCVDASIRRSGDRPIRADRRPSSRQGRPSRPQPAPTTSPAPGGDSDAAGMGARANNDTRP